MRGNTKVAITHYLIALLLAVTALEGCKADGVKPVEGSAGGIPAIAKSNQADFAKLANHTVLVSLEREDARAFGGDLPPDKTLPLEVRSLAIMAIPPQPCPLVGLTVETDNRPKTREWLVMQHKSCPPIAPHGWRLFWVVQQGTDGVTRVLFSDKAHSVKLMEWTQEAKTDSPVQRPISVTRAGRTCPTCGSINCEGFWQNKTGVYQRPSQFLVERTRYDSVNGLDQSLAAEGSCPLD